MASLLGIFGPLLIQIFTKWIGNKMKPAGGAAAPQEHQDDNRLAKELEAKFAEAKKSPEHAQAAPGSPEHGLFSSITSLIAALKGHDWSKIGTILTEIIGTLSGGTAPAPT